jgi:Delta7-sterol 5-desaturase
VAVWKSIQDFVANVDPLNWWIGAFVVGGLLAGISSGYFKARKIQPKGFKWKIFRREIFWAVINVTISAAVIGGLTKYLQHIGIIRFNHDPTSPWVIALEYALYFILLAASRHAPGAVL